MATSSIFANFNIIDSKKAEDFARALDISAKENSRKSAGRKNAFVSLPDEIKSLWAKRKVHK